MDSKLSIKVFKKRVENASWRMVLASLDNSFDSIEENASYLTTSSQSIEAYISPSANLPATIRVNS